MIPTKSYSRRPDHFGARSANAGSNRHGAHDGRGFDQRAVTGLCRKRDPGDRLSDAAVAVNGKSAMMTMRATAAIVAGSNGLARPVRPECRHTWIAAIQST